MAPVTELAGLPVAPSWPSWLCWNVDMCPATQCPLLPVTHRQPGSPPCLEAHTPSGCGEFASVTLF